MKKPTSDRYNRMAKPLLQALRDAGGAGKPRDLQMKVADEVLGASEERNEFLKSGQNRAENEVAWARNYLRMLGLIDGSEFGVWRLTPEGWSLDLKQPLELVSTKAAKTSDASLSDKSKSGSAPRLVELLPDEDQADPIIAGIMQLNPAGFERLCARVLTELGFHDVKVTGSSGDGGIDGIGKLTINELYSLKFAFQCKRYQQAVTPEQIRDFRGALRGRASRGIFLTTSSFTKSAKEEASRVSDEPIELVDGARLVELMKTYSIGVIPRTEYDIDPVFFDNLINY